MFKKSLQTLKLFNQSFSFAMSESKLVIKREKQAKLAQKIKEALNPTFVKVDDISIGSSSCGEMYNIKVESEMFKDKTLVQQHKMVTQCIAEQLKSIHGYNLKTKAPQSKQKEPIFQQESKEATNKSA